MAEVVDLADTAVTYFFYFSIILCYTIKTVLKSQFFAHFFNIHRLWWSLGRTWPSAWRWLWYNFEFLLKEYKKSICYVFKLGGYGHGSYPHGGGYGHGNHHHG